MYCHNGMPGTACFTGASTTNPKHRAGSRHHLKDFVWESAHAHKIVAAIQGRAKDDLSAALLISTRHCNATEILTNQGQLSSAQV